MVWVDEIVGWGCMRCGNVRRVREPGWLIALCAAVTIVSLAAIFRGELYWLYVMLQERVGWSLF
jgi:hypothetical protein